MCHAKMQGVELIPSVRDEHDDAFQKKAKTTKK
jgi:hypothetical protein